MELGIYHFSIPFDEGIPIPPGTKTNTEFFTLLATHDIGATLLKLEAEYPLNLTPRNSKNLKYLLALDRKDEARLDIYGEQGEPLVGTPRSIFIPADKTMVSIKADDTSGLPRLHEVIAALPHGVASWYSRYIRDEY